MSDMHMALVRARNHIDTARYELKRVHPEMDPDEPCIHFEAWDELGRIRNLYFSDLDAPEHSTERESE